MHARSFHKLFREWMALFAILAMVLGPLALLTSRSLAAQERVNVAAGLASLPICAPGDSIDGLSAKTGGGACDHCLPVLGAAPAMAQVQSGACAFAATVFPADTGPSALLRQLRLPPATGPPAF
jgi:hypothetical protein